MSTVEYSAEEKERARQLASSEWRGVCRRFDEEWGEKERTNCHEIPEPCGGCYECQLGYLLQEAPSWSEYLARARRELANEAFGTTCVDCGREFGDEDETVPDEDGNLLHVGCGDRP